MKRKRLTEEQIMGILREQEAGADLPGKHGGLHAALTDGSAFRPVAHSTPTGIKLPEALKAAG